MLFPGFGEDTNIIEVDKDIVEATKNLFHNLLHKIMGTFEAHTKRYDDDTELLGSFVKFEGIILNQDIKFCKVLVSQDLLHNIVDNRQGILFTLDAFVERAKIRDLSDLAILFGNNEARQGPLGVSAFSKNSIYQPCVGVLF